MRKAMLAALAIATFTVISAGSASTAVAQAGLDEGPDAQSVIWIGDFNNLSRPVLIWPGQNGNVLGVNIPDQGSILIGGFANQIVPGAGFLMQGINTLGILIPLEPPIGGFKTQDVEPEVAKEVLGY